MEQKLVKFLNLFSTVDFTDKEWDKIISAWYKYDSDGDTWINYPIEVSDFLYDVIRDALENKFDEIEGNKDNFSFARAYLLSEELPEDTNSIIKALWKEAQDDYFSIFPRYEK